MLPACLSVCLHAQWSRFSLSTRPPASSACVRVRPTVRHSAHTAANHHSTPEDGMESCTKQARWIYYDATVYSSRVANFRLSSYARHPPRTSPNPTTDGGSSSGSPSAMHAMDAWNSSSPSHKGGVSNKLNGRPRDRQGCQGPAGMRHPRTEAGGVQAPGPVSINLEPTATIVSTHP